MATVSIRPLEPDEYDAWEADHIRVYAEGMAAFAGLSDADATAKAERDLPFVLPDGLATEGVRLWVVEAEGGRRVGTVFLGLRDGGAWLYDITIETAERGRGLGRAAMLALEAEVCRLGHDLLSLNVWGGNEIARGLYRSLGFTERSVHMDKRL